MATATKTKQEPVVEAEDCVDPDPVVEPEPLEIPANVGPNQCGSNPCHSRKAVVITNTNTGRTYTFTPSWDGNNEWDFGDGSPKVVARGPVTYTYAGAGARTVKAQPLASSVMRFGTKAITVT